LTVIEDLNVLLDGGFGLVSGLVATVMYQFVVEGAPEVFHQGVAIVVSSMRHGYRHAELLKNLLIVVRTVLNATIQMMDLPPCRSFLFYRLKYISFAFNEQ
jgi:hypothetical protein